MICKECKKKVKYGGASMYFPARENKLCPDCFKVGGGDRMTEMPKVNIFKVAGGKEFCFDSVCKNEDRLAQLRWNNSIDSELCKRIQNLAQDPYPDNWEEGNDYKDIIIKVVSELDDIFKVFENKIKVIDKELEGRKEKS